MSNWLPSFNWGSTPQNNLPNLENEKRDTTPIEEDFQIRITNQGGVLQVVSTTEPIGETNDNIINLSHFIADSYTADDIETRALINADQITRIQSEHENDALINEFTLIDRADQLGKERILELHNVELLPITLQEVQPGDVICTYESTSTSPTISMATTAQLLTDAGRKKNLHKMLHFEIVLEKSDLTGVIKVAHANGSSSRIQTDFQDLSRFPKGTAIVVMRPRNPAMRRELMRVAETTADKGNEWKIKGISDDQSSIKVLTDKVRGKTKEQHVRKMARMAVGSYDKFTKKDGELKAMSCAQFASNVINSSLIRLDPEMADIIQSDLSREEKIEEIYQKLNERNFEEVYAAGGLFHDDVTSALLSYQILSHPEEWEIPGYIGSVGDDLEEKPPAVIRGSYPIKLKELGKLGIGTEDQVSQVFRELDLFAENNYLDGDPGVKKVRLMAAFSYLYAYQLGLDASKVAMMIADQKDEDKIDDFLGKIKDPKVLEAYLEAETRWPFFRDGIHLLEEVPPNQSTITAPPFKQIAYGYDWSFSVDRNQLNTLEKQLMKSCTLTPEEHGFLLSQNTIKKQSLQYSSNFKYLEGATLMGGALLSIVNPLVGIPVTLGLAGGAYLGEKTVERSMEAWANKVKGVRTLGNPNFTLSLNVDAGMGRRPWMLYQDHQNPDLWLVKPFNKREGSNTSWDIDLLLEGDLEYKIFKGPWDMHDFSPMEGAEWEEVDGSDPNNIENEGFYNHYLSKEQMEDLHYDEGSEKRIGDITGNVQW